MDQRIKALWIDALRSGEYKQGDSALRLEGKGGSMYYCCLGVLCDILVKEGTLPEWSLHSSTDEPGVGAVYGIPVNADYWESGALPPGAQEVSGIETATGRLPDGVSIESEQSLVGLNDVKGFTFEQIADVIDSHL